MQLSKMPACNIQARAAAAAVTPSSPLITCLHASMQARCVCHRVQHGHVSALKLVTPLLTART